MGMEGAAAGGGYGKMAGSILGGAAVLAGAGGEGGREYYREALSLWRKLQTPNFDYRTLSPPELRMVAEMFPETYEAVVPEEVKLPEDSPELRSSQARALAEMEQVAEEGIPLEDRLAAEGAGREMMGVRRAGEQAAMADLRRRGRAGGAAEIAARLAGGQQAANLSRDLGSDLARESLRRRLAAVQASGDMAGAMRQQDIGLSSRRADVANQYNRFLAELQTRAARDAAAARQGAQAYNVGERQRVADTNVLNKYATSLENLNRQNQLREAQFGADVRKTTGLTGALGGYGDYKERQRREREEAIMGLGEGVGELAGTAAGSYF